MQNPHNTPANRMLDGYCSSIELTVTVSPSRAPFTLAFKSFSLLVDFRAAKALAQLTAHLLVWLDKSLPLHMTSTNVPVQVSANAPIESSEAVAQSSRVRFIRNLLSL